MKIKNNQMNGKFIYKFCNDMYLIVDILMEIWIGEFSDSDDFRWQRIRYWTLYQNLYLFYCSNPWSLKTIPAALCSSAILRRSMTWAGWGWGVGMAADSARNPFSFATKVTGTKLPSASWILRAKEKRISVLWYFFLSLN